MKIVTTIDNFVKQNSLILALAVILTFVVASICGAIVKHQYDQNLAYLTEEHNSLVKEIQTEKTHHKRHRQAFTRSLGLVEDCNELDFQISKFEQKGSWNEIRIQATAEIPKDFSQKLLKSCEAMLRETLLHSQFSKGECGFTYYLTESQTPTVSFSCDAAPGIAELFNQMF